MIYRRRLLAACTLTLLLAAAVTSGGEPDALRKVFPFTADITTAGPGLSRLYLPPLVLEQCRSDLSDLRIFDARGREVPYVVDTRRDQDPGLEVLSRVKAEVLEVERHRQGKAYGPTRYVETFTLAVPPLPPAAGSWDLVLTSQRRELVVRLDITAIGADGTSTVLVDGGSAFRLPAPAVERMRFALATLTATRLEVVVSGEDQGYLEPTLSFEAVRSLHFREPPQVALEQLEIVHSADRSVVVLERPRGLVPSRLRLSSTTGAFHRQVTVWDEGADAEAAPLALGALLRIDAIVPVEVSELSLDPARGDRLRLVIMNHDSPPLDDIRISAVVPQPVLFFSLSAEPAGASLSFGGARAHRPRYDLAALLPALPAAGESLTGQKGERGLAFWDPARSQVASLGPVRSNPSYDPAPALAYAMHPGAILSPGPYSHRRRLQVKPSPEGLARLPLSPEDLALVRTDLADLRVVDEQSQQWAYLLEQGSATTSVKLSVNEQKTAQGKTTYAITSPVSPLTSGRIVLEIDSPFFDRAFQLRGAAADEELRRLASGRLVRRNGDPRPIIIGLEEQRLDQLELEVVDGDDAPLRITQITARVPQPDLYLAAPAGEYSLLLGFPDAPPPRYELTRVRATVLAVPAASIVAGDLERNPKFRAGSRIGGAGLQQLLLWVVLGVAVVGLIGLTLWLARQNQPSETE